MTDSMAALIEAARVAAQHAYCPYSNFRVGAAVFAGNGKIYSGCNVENISFGLTICAERSAVSQMIVDGQSNLSAVAVYTFADTPTTPCGACRQVLREFGDQVEVACVTADDQRLDTTLDDLLPCSVIIHLPAGKPRPS